MTMTFDLGRIYLNTIFAKEVVLTTAKIARSTNPASEVPDMFAIVNPVSGESSSITQNREDFWAHQLDSSHSLYHGLDYFTSKELRVFNLGYGFIASLNSSVAFPIPSPINSVDDLGGKTNCSISFEFLETPDPLIPSKNYDRLYTCRCEIPLFGLRIFNAFTGMEYLTVTQTAYAYQSGDISP